jgi:hypothetical protein
MIAAKNGATDKKWVKVNESREVSWWASALATYDRGEAQNGSEDRGQRVKDIRKHLAK